MLQSTSDYYILFVPILLIGLGLGLGLLWWNFRHLISIFWLVISLLCNGSAILIQSVISTTNLVHHHFYLAIFYLVTYISLTQSILVIFNYRISLKFCLFILLITEIGCLYFSFFDESTTVRMFVISLGVTLILLHRSPFILRFPVQVWYEGCLKVVFGLTLLLFISRTILLATFIYKTEYNPTHFGSISHWFISQLSILSLTLLFVALLLSLNFRRILEAQQRNMEQIRAQQHLQFTHDLHDIVGSTLVRSISRLNNNKQTMDNQQFLLLFEQLKSDLSEVTTTERLEVKNELSLTPEQWALPIRQRFDGIFAELGITPIWQLAENWLIQPSTEELLTLQRVAEELLTNIIKHSQAKKVSVHLSHSHLYQFILEIEDDGIGFDATFAMNNSHGVGLRSIKQRLQNIQTEIYIYSDTCKTSFRIFKVKSS